MFKRSDSTALTSELKSWILSEMIEAGSLNYVRDILLKLQDEMLKSFEVAEGGTGTKHETESPGNWPENVAVMMEKGAAPAPKIS